ncbi:hypothetical protein [Qaidamihabitans albus]|uniref:hypothetical protein n=1 Tax=Qaidamihabitans albus TaxID=2795733 RepID=UPI0018F20017|nr:hypothetical protein [Qaidamihabitans albus]
MRVDELLSKAREAVSARRVYTDPVEKNGVTVMFAAVVIVYLLVRGRVARMRGHERAARRRPGS